MNGFVKKNKLNSKFHFIHVQVMVQCALRYSYLINTVQDLRASIESRVRRPAQYCTVLVPPRGRKEDKEQEQEQWCHKGLPKASPTILLVQYSYEYSCNAVTRICTS